jgi:adenine-specific DNA-methyltransferase
MTEKLEKLTAEDGKSLDIETQNIEQLKQLFPDVFNEGKVDFEALKAVLGEHVEDQEERYNFTWHGKNKARQIAQTPSTGTLRPCKEESVNWDTTQNMFIEGDNLEVLKLLQKSYHKKVKMIYIDPPYNTGKDFVYKDNFHDNIKNYLKITGQVDSDGQKLSSNSDTSGRYHTDWLNMIYPRLKLAKNLLKDDGMIFISIDDSEIKNLRVICDEIFGEQNFIESIIWKKRYGGGAKEKYLVSLHEYVLVYAKNIDFIKPIFVSPKEGSEERYYKTKDEKFAIRGGYRTHPLEAGKAMDERTNLRYSIPAPDGSEIWPKRQWLWGKDRALQALENNDLDIYKGKDGSWTIHTKQYQKDENGVERQAKAFSLIDDVYTQHGTNEQISLFESAKYFSYPKPTEFLYKLLDVGLDSEPHIILDFFAGSSSTAHAIQKMNLKLERKNRYIMVQLPEPLPEDSDSYKAGFRTISEVSVERIKRSEKQLLQEGLPEELVGFKYFKLDETNIHKWEANFENISDILDDSVESLKAERSCFDVLFEIIIKYGLDLTYPITEHKLAGKTVYDVAFGSLMVCLDDGITREVVEAIGKLKQELDSETTRVVFKDAGFADDAVKVNAIQLLKQYGVDDVKSI